MVVSPSFLLLHVSPVVHLGPHAREPIHQLCLFWLAIGCWYLYFPIRNNLGGRVIFCPTRADSSLGQPALGPNISTRIQAVALGPPTRHECHFPPRLHRSQAFIQFTWVLWNNQQKGNKPWTQIGSQSWSSFVIHPLSLPQEELGSTPQCKAK